MSKRTTTTEAEATETGAIPAVEALAPAEYAARLSALAAKGYDDNDSTTVALAITGALEAEARNQAATIVTTIRHRVVIGQGLINLARLAREVKAGGKAVTPAEAEKAARASGIAEVSLSRTTIGLALRTAAVFYGQVDDLTTTARDLWNVEADDAPAEWTATGVLVWAEARTGKATESNRGKRPATLAEAKAKAEARTETTAKAEAEAKARREAIGQAVADGGKAVVVKGLRLTYGQLDNLSTEALSALRTVIDDMIAARDLAAKAAKAEAEAKAKAATADAEAEAKAIRDQAKAEAEAILAEALAKVAK